MSDIIHYIIVRRDLPFGVALAMVAHAAAESNSLQPRHCTVCVLGTRDEGSLRKLARRLQKKCVPHLVVTEPDVPWYGAQMAIGVQPGTREELSGYFKKMQTYSVYEGPNANPYAFLCMSGRNTK